MKFPPLLSSLLLARTVHADEFQKDCARLWKEPQFRKQPLAAYRTDAQVEPHPTPEERDLLHKAYDPPAKETAAAIKFLEAAPKNDSSARLDFTLGTMHFQTDRRQDAQKRFKPAIARFPNFRRARLFARSAAENRAGQSPRPARRIMRIFVTIVTRIRQIQGHAGFPFSMRMRRWANGAAP